MARHPRGAPAVATPLRHGLLGFARQPSFTNVAVGATATAAVPVGLTYTALDLRYKRGGADATEAQLKSDIDEVRLMIDGDEKWRLTGPQLVDILKYYGNPITAGVLPLLFARPWQREAASEDHLSLGTADVATISIEVDINGAAVTPDLSLQAEYAGVARPLGNFLAYRPFPRSPGGAGVFEISDLPKGPYGLVAIHMDTALILDVEVVVNNRILFEADRQQMVAAYARKGRDRIVQTGWTVIDFARTSRLEDVLNLNVQDLRVKLNMSGAASFDVILERIEDRARGV